MASPATWTCNKDARIADNGSSLGAGTSDFNPIGLSGGYKYRTLLGFSYSFSGMVAITSAILHIRTSTQYYCAFGSDPDIEVRRILENWSEGSSSGLSASNAVNWANQPTTTATNQGVADITTSESTWDTVDITALIQDAMAAGVFYGLKLFAVGEDSTETDTTEIYSREQGSSDPYIVVTYTSNVVPTAPTLTAPTSGATLAGTTPTLSFSHNDADGDALLDYDLQVSTDSTFATVTHMNVAAQTTFKTGNTVNRVYGAPGVALTRGVTYYWRARTSSATGILTESAWSLVRSFKLNRLPTVTLVTPSAVNALVEVGRITTPATNPRMVVRWTYSDPDGGAQVKYRVLVQNDSAGSPGSTFYDSGVQTSAIAALTIPVDVARNVSYHVSVTVYDALNESATAGPIRCRTQWTVMEYRLDTGGVPTGWSTSVATVGGTNKSVIVEYASSAAGGAITTWYSALSSAAKARWFHWRVWLFAWSGATSPSLTKMALTYTSAVGVPPDGWTVTGQHSLDTGQKVYGTQSLRVDCDGTTIAASQLVQVQKNTDYILSGRIRSVGNSQAFISLSSGPVFGAIGSSEVAVGDQEFTRVKTPIWNSGDNEDIYVICRVNNGPAGAIAWFDALKLEASRVVTAWNPGLVGAGLSVDAGGIKVDASPAGGATFRLQGSTVAGGRSTVELGTTGLVWGGDTLLESPAANMLRLSDGSFRARRPGVGDEAFASHETASLTLRFRIAADGGMQWGPTTGAFDSALSRVAPGQLKVKNQLNVGEDNALAVLYMGLERAWQFDQGSTGANAFLRIRPLVDGKRMAVVSTDTLQEAMAITPSNVAGGARINIPSAVSFQRQAVQTLAAGTQIAITGTQIAITTSGAVVPTAVPSIAAPASDGTLLVIVYSGAGSWQARDATSLASSGLKLATATYTMGDRDVLTLMYMLGFWIEVSRSVNL